MKSILMLPIVYVCVWLSVYVLCENNERKFYANQMNFFHFQ